MDVFPPFVFLIIVKVAFSFCLWILLPWVQILITSFICIPQISSWIADCELIFCVRFLSIWSVFSMAQLIQVKGEDTVVAACASCCFQSMQNWHGVMLSGVYW